MTRPQTPLQIAKENAELVAARLRELPDDFTAEDHACRLDMVASQIEHGMKLLEAELARYQWQPIETMPKDTKILTWCTNCVFMADFIPADATHWMPLPAPPEPKQ